MSRFRSIILQLAGLKKSTDCIDKNSWEVQQQNELERISHLEQTSFEKAVLYINLVIILIGAVFLYAYFSINPFTSEEIFDIQSNLNYSIVDFKTIDD